MATVICKITANSILGYWYQQSTKDVIHNVVFVLSIISILYDHAQRRVDTVYMQLKIIFSDSSVSKLLLALM